MRHTPNIYMQAPQTILTFKSRKIILVQPELEDRSAHPDNTKYATPVIREILVTLVNRVTMVMSETKVVVIVGTNSRKIFVTKNFPQNLLYRPA
jgi:hypothetical protein